MTSQRRAILGEIERTSSHPTADEIYDLVRKKLPRISLGTVYRNLEILAECGRIRKIDLGDGHRRFDANIENHYHVRCVRCRQVMDLYLDPVCDMEAMIRKQTGFEVLGHRLDFFGLCPVCKRRKESEEAAGPERREAAGPLPEPEGKYEGGCEGEESQGIGD